MAVPARLGNSLALIALAAACAGGPPEPDWRAKGAQALAAYERLYLSGETSAAEREFAVARSELARTGRADLVARAELVRCAVRAASLEFDGCPGFEKLRGDAGAEERAYAEYLAGRAPRPTRGEEPLSRLVAAAVALRRGDLAPSAVATAVDTASEQGWRRALLAWLGVQEKRARDAGDTEAAARIRRRMELISG